jgi:hypothetical protein
VAVEEIGGEVGTEASAGVPAMTGEECGGAAGNPDRAGDADRAPRDPQDSDRSQRHTTS